ncbi:MAG: hypothetical protein ACI965_001248, partial [Paraglaciecola sp.]
HVKKKSSHWLLFSDFLSCFSRKDPGSAGS